MFIGKNTIPKSRDANFNYKHFTFQLPQREVLFYDKNYTLKIFIINITNMLLIKRSREENTSDSSKIPTSESVKPPALIRQPATLGKCFILSAKHQKIND